MNKKLVDKELVKDVLALLFSLEDVPSKLKEKSADVVLKFADNTEFLESLKGELEKNINANKVNFIRGLKAGGI